MYWSHFLLFHFDIPKESKDLYPRLQPYKINFLICKLYFQRKAVCGWEYQMMTILAFKSVITSHIFPDRVAFCLNFPSFISNYVLYVCTCIYDQKLKTSSLTFLEMIFQILLYVK